MWNATPTTVIFNFDGGSNAQRNAASAAMDMWNSVKHASTGANLVTMNLSTSVDTNNDIFFSARLGYFGAFGETLYTYQEGSSTILESVDVELNSKYSWGTTGGSGVDVQTIVGHELGHALGVAHCHAIGESSCFSATCSTNLMNPAWGVGDVVHSLTSYDISSYQLIYY